MLQIQHICKKYVTGKLVQNALDDVSLNLRDNEFVAILGPSGSGKTTLLNIIGGLDRYDSGDLIINSISTKEYKDRDWDSYRNHTIGFVFQSYNLIPHQTLLSNVELALTISGIGKAERRQRAREALEKVGLGEQVEKRPNQLSGGQMQRVAIARALVNNPDILLADEPTGALDSDTSVQVMDLLKEVAKDRLVVMVTHNPELAEQYATRIVKLRDGKIREDSDPFLVDETSLAAPEHKNMGKSSMSFLTALALSFNNLRTKKARTLLTAFAGSIGIIGIALILSLSTGVNDYIKSIEEETLSEYPLQIMSTGFNLGSMMASNMGGHGGQERTSGDDEVNVIQMVSDMFSTMDTNDLTSLKKYLESEKSGIHPYVNSIEYSYNVAPQIYRQDKDSIRRVNPDSSFDALGIGSSASSSSLMSSMMSTDVFYELPSNPALYENQYEVKAGHWPENYNECVVVLSPSGSISDFLLYTLGLRDSMELNDMIQQFMNGEDVEVPEDIGTYTYDDILNVSFKLVNSSDYYEYDSQYKIWKDKTDNKEYMKELVKDGEDIKIVGIVKPLEDAKSRFLNTGIYYPDTLTAHVIDKAEKSEIVQNQLSKRDTNIFTNEAFGEERNSEFDTDSLFTVDTDALENAFGFDTAALGGLSGSMDLSNAFNLDSGTFDMSGMVDLGSIHLTLPEMPEIQMSDLMDSVEITASSEDVNRLVSDFLAGYQEYAKQHPEADYSHLTEDFLSYLNTSEAQQILLENMKAILESAGNITVSKDQLQQLVAEVMAGYQDYAAEKGYTDPEKFDEYLLEYLATSNAQAILTNWAEKNFQISGNVTITQEQLEQLTAGLVAGYQAYAAENGLADPSRMGEHFRAYLGTDTAKNILTSGITSMVDTAGLEQQIASSIEGYMQSAFVSYGSAVSSALESQITSAMGQMMNQIAGNMETVMTQAMSQIGNSLQNAMNIDADAFASAFTMNMDGENLKELMMSMNSASSVSYENNLQTLGYADLDEPSEIDIYPLDFESKEQVIEILDNYNDQMTAEGKEDQVISYTDMVGTLMSSVTDIIDIISYVLIAFIAISLVVSSIMIGVITYISVLERKKEIGILRAIGASKRNISQVFNAETGIIGLCAGLIGIGLSLLLLIPGNALIHHFAGTNDVNAVLPVLPAIVLILLSVVLTLIGGLIPSKKAAKSDPVTALRTD